MVVSKAFKTLIVFGLLISFEFTFANQNQCANSFASEQGLQSSSTGTSLVLALPKAEEKPELPAAVNKAELELATRRYDDPSYLALYINAYPETHETIFAFSNPKTGLLFSDYFFRSLHEFLISKEAPKEEPWSNEFLDEITREFQELIFDEFSVRSKGVDSVAAEGLARRIKERLGKNSFNYTGNQFLTHRESLVKLLLSPNGDQIFKTLIYHSLSFYQNSYKLSFKHGQKLSELKSQHEKFHDWAQSYAYWDDGGAGQTVVSIGWAVIGTMLLPYGASNLEWFLYAAYSQSILPGHFFQRIQLMFGNQLAYLTRKSFASFVSRPLRALRISYQKSRAAKRYRALLKHSAKNKGELTSDLAVDSNFGNTLAFPDIPPLRSDEVAAVKDQLIDPGSISEISKFGSELTDLNLRFEALVTTYIHSSSLVANEIFDFVLQFDGKKVAQLTSGQINQLAEAFASRESRVSESTEQIAVALEMATLLKDKAKKILQQLEEIESDDPVLMSTVEGQIEILSSHQDLVKSVKKYTKTHYDRLVRQRVILSKALISLRRNPDRLSTETAELLSELREIILQTTSEQNGE